MWNKLNLPEQLKKKEPPVDGVLAGAYYSGKVEESDVAILQAKLNFVRRSSRAGPSSCSAPL